MNEEELRNKINASIKCEKLRDYLFGCLKSECALNSLSSPSSFIDNSSQRLKDKIKACQKIESDLHDKLPDPYIILPKLRELRKLVIEYTESLIGIREKKSRYDEIKDFILKILSLNFNLQLKYFDLTILLLPKIFPDQQLNKEFIAALDLLKLFVNENHIPNEENLQSINNLDREENEGIRKCFYGIIYELDKKLLFRDLLNQLLEIIKNQNKIPLMQFSTIFITMCLNDKEMEAEALNQAIDLVYQALKHPEHAIKSGFNGLKKIFNQKNLSDYLTEFEKDFQEKISQTIIDNLNKNAQKKETYHVADILKEFDFVTCFPTHEINKIIMNKLYEAKAVYKKPKNSITDNEKITLKQRLNQFGNRAYSLLEVTKTKASAVKEDLEEFAGTNAIRLTSFIKKNSETLHLEESEKTHERALNKSLAKARLLPIKEKLNAWNLIINDPEPHDNYYNQIYTGPIDLEHCLESIAALDVDINDKYSLLIPEILNIFEKIITNMKEKDYWFAEHEINKSSLAYKIFCRGYFNIDFSIKKINAKLGNKRSFDKINDFISTQNFWTLLTYGIVRWPWMDKTIFSCTWAEQLCLSEVITEIEKLKNKFLNNTNDQLLNEIMALLEIFPPFKDEAVTHILDDFKKNIVIQLTKLEALEQKIDEHLNNERKNFLPVITSITQFFSKKTVSDDSDKINFIAGHHC